MKSLYALLFTLSCIWAPASAQIDCDIFELVTEAHPCVNGTFLVDIDFAIENPEGEMFGVVGNSTNYGEFAYADLPITVGPIDADNDTEWFFIVYDLEEPNCQETDTLGIVNCCGFSEVTIDPQDCVNSEVFTAVVDFEFENTGNLGFDVYDFNNNHIGFYMYSALPVTVTGIPSTGNQTNEITICDNDSETCCITIEFEGPDCDPTNCEIYNVVAEAGDCEDGEFSVTITFDYENVTQSFTVMGNGNNYGTFDYDDLPITLGPFDGDGETVYEFVVKDDEIDGCMDFAVIEPVECPEACGFHEIVVEPEGCQGEDNYSLFINFIPVSTSDEGFNLYGSNQFLGDFGYDQLPLLLDSFPASGDFFDTLIICDIVDTTCCDTIQFQALQCGDCIIYDVVAEALECDSNMQFQVVLDFEYQNVSDSFQVGGNGNTYGQWPYSDLPITLGPFDGDTVTFYEFVVIDLGGGLCLAGTELGQVNCIDPCTIGELNVDPLECTGPFMYNLFLNFEHENTDTAGFDVYANGEFFGFFLYDELPIILENFPSSGNDFDFITVCDNDDPECCETLEFLSPGCIPECDIRDLVVDPIACTSDSTFSALVSFIYENLPEDSVEIYSEGQFLGIFAVDTLPLLITNIPVNPGETGLLVCATGVGECCEDVGFESLVCDSTCLIFDIVLDGIECDDEQETFSMWVNFSYQNVTNDFFEMWNNGEYLGLFEFNDLPIFLDSLPGSGENALLEICVNDNDTCCAQVEYETPDCGPEPCSLRDVVLDEIACGEEGQFSMWINFIYEGVTNDFFEVWNNDEYLGLFAFDSLPVYLDGLPGTGENAVLEICVNDNDTCCVELEYETPDCVAECEIWDLVVDEMACTDGGEFGMWVNFNYEGVTNDFFEVWSDDEYLGLYPFDSLPVFVDGIPGDGHNAVLLVCVNDNDGCCAELEYETPDCGACDFTELSVDPVACTSDSTFSAWINFEATGLDSNGVDIYAGDEYLGFFPLVTPLLVTNIPDGEGGILIEVCSADTFPEPLCCAAVEIDQLSCEEDICPIGEVTVEASECDSNGMFFVTLDIELLDDPPGGFLVAGNGTTYGSFEYNDLPITLGPLEGDSMTVWEFIAIDLMDLQCSNFAELGIIDCDPSAIWSPANNVYTLDIRYSTSGPFFIAPPNGETATLWTVEGRQAALFNSLGDGTTHPLWDRGLQPGIYLIAVNAGDRIYVGKVVVAE